MRKQLFNLSIEECSLVKYPAVKKAKILISKSGNTDNVGTSSRVKIQKSFNIVKADEPEKKVFGYALVPDETDEQGHKISKEEIKKAVDRYNRNLALGFKKGTGVGYEHKLFDDSIGAPYINVYDETGAIAKAFGIPEDKIIPGAWLTGTQLTDKGYKKYLKGEITGWSIGGVGEELIEEENEMNKSIDNQPLPEWIPQFYTKMKTLLDEEAPAIDEYEKEYIIKNTIAHITFEVEYQALSDMDKSLNVDKSKAKKKKSPLRFLKNLFKSKEEPNLDIDEMIDEKVNPLIDAVNTLTETVKSLKENDNDGAEKTDKENTVSGKASEEIKIKTEKIQKSNEFDELKTLIESQNQAINTLSKKVNELQKSKPNSTQLDNDKSTANILSGSLFED